MQTNIKKIRLYILGYKGYKVLEAITNQFGKDIIYTAIIAKDPNIQNDYYSEARKFCEVNSINFVNRTDDKHISDCYSIAIGWRWIIDLNRVKNLIVIHDSLLPKKRGFNPLVTSLINGDKYIGVTALYAEKMFDSGDIIYQSSQEIDYPIKIEEAISKITLNYIDVAIKIIEDLINNKMLPRVKQAELEVSYSLWRDEEDYHINWDWDSSQIVRFIDAVGYPFSGAYSIIDEKKIRIFDAEEIWDVCIENRSPGKVIYFDDEDPVIVCGKGLLKITNMVYENKQYKLKKIRTRFI